MLVPVVEHDIAQEGDARHGCDLLIASDDAPGCVHGSVIEARQDIAHGGDAIAATKAIRSNPRLLSLPIVAMTANAMDSDREMCLKAGMVDHVAQAD